MSAELEKFNARLDEEIKKLMGPDFSGSLDHENGHIVKYKGIEEQSIGSPGVRKIAEMVAWGVAEELDFDLEIFMD